MKNTTVTKTIYIFPSQRVASVAGPLMLRHFAEHWSIWRTMGVTFTIGLENGEPAILATGPKPYLPRETLRTFEATVRDFTAGVMAQREATK